MSVAKNTRITPRRAQIASFLGGFSFIPLAQDYIAGRNMAKDVARYNQGKNQKQGLNATKNDKYFHQHGMYRAAKPGVWSALNAALLGELKEYKDFFQSKDPYDAKEAERKKDLKNNYLAIKMALEGNKPVDEVIIPNDTIKFIWEQRKNGEI